MKTNVIGVIIVFILGTVCSVNLLAQGNDKVSEIRKVGAFSSIEVTSVATVYFTQSDTYSLKIEGKEKYVKGTTSKVENGHLEIDFKEKGKQFRNRKTDVKIYLSAPNLKEVSFTGVGSFNCESPLNLDDVEFEVEGVGKLYVKDLTCKKLKVNLEGVGEADVHVNCDYLSATLDGIGQVTLSGRAGKANISKSGIGSVNTRHLKVGR